MTSNSDRKQNIRAVAEQQNVNYTTAERLYGQAIKGLNKYGIAPTQERIQRLTAGKPVLTKPGEPIWIDPKADTDFAPFVGGKQIEIRPAETGEALDPMVLPGEALDPNRALSDDLHHEISKWWPKLWDRFDATVTHFDVDPADGGFLVSFKAPDDIDWLDILKAFRRRMLDYYVQLVDAVPGHPGVRDVSLFVAYEDPTPCTPPKANDLRFESGQVTIGVSPHSKPVTLNFNVPARQDWQQIVTVTGPSTARTSLADVVSAAASNSGRPVNRVDFDEIPSAEYGTIAVKANSVVVVENVQNDPMPDAQDKIQTIRDVFRLARSKNVTLVLTSEETLTPDKVLVPYYEIDLDTHDGLSVVTDMFGGTQTFQPYTGVKD